MANIQDVLSGLKSFAKSDTGKNVAKVAGLIAAGYAGGSEGIKAYGNVFENFKREEERKKIEEENRDTRKIQKAKAELDLEFSREKLNEQKNKSYADLQQKILGASMGVDGLQGALTKAQGADKYGKITPYDVAIEPRPEGSAKGSTKTEKEPSGLKPPAPTPVSIDDEKLVASGKLEAAKWAAKIAAQMGIIGAGKEAWDKNKIELDQDLKNTGMTQGQQNAAWKELSSLIMPGRREELQSQQMADYNPDYTSDETNAQLLSTAREYSGVVPGALTGMKLGSFAGPLGTVVGGAFGGAAGYAMSKVATDYFEGQKDAAPTPAVAGTDKTVVDDMASYSGDSERAIEIANGLARTGIGANDTPAIIEQLSRLPEFAVDKERRDKMLEIIRAYLPKQQEPTMSWQNQNAWRSL